MELKEHNEHCQSIVDEMEKYASGDYFCYDGELLPFYETDEEFWKSGEDYKYVEDDEEAYEPYYLIDGEVCYESDTLTVSLFDFFEDVYDIKYIVDSNKEYCSVRLMVACGGPNIYIDTDTKQVELYWWNESGSAYIPSELVNEIDSYWEEFFNS